MHFSLRYCTELTILKKTTSFHDTDLVNQQLFVRLFVRSEEKVSTGDCRIFSVNADFAKLLHRFREFQTTQVNFNVFAGH